jgi:hypothetical protein
MAKREIKTVVNLWRKKVCKNFKKLDPGDDYCWESIWVGFVCALDRPDLATYSKYQQYGFPVELEELEEQILP